MGFLFILHEFMYGKNYLMAVININFHFHILFAWNISNIVCVYFFRLLQHSKRFLFWNKFFARFRL